MLQTRTFPALVLAVHAYVETTKIVYPTEYGGRTLRKIDGDLTLVIFNKQGHHFDEVSLSGEVFQHPTSEYYVGKFEPVPEETCSGCGAPGRYYEGLCYQCQCEYHAVGRYDMDGAGWLG